MQVAPVTKLSQTESTMTFSSPPPWVTRLSKACQNMYSTDHDLSSRTVLQKDGQSKAKALFSSLKERKSSIYTQIENIQTEEDLLERDENGQTLLHRLCAPGYEYYMELLLEKAKNSSTDCLEKCLLAVDNNHKTAFYLACENNLVTAVEILIGRASTGSSDDLCSNICYRLLTTTDNPKDLQSGSHCLEGKTPLYAACEKKHYAILKTISQRTRPYTFFSNHELIREYFRHELLLPSGTEDHKGKKYPTFNNRLFLLACKSEFNGELFKYLTHFSDTLLQTNPLNLFLITNQEGKTLFELIVRSRGINLSKKTLLIKYCLLRDPTLMTPTDTTTDTLFPKLELETQKTLLTSEVTAAFAIKYACSVDEKEFKRINGAQIFQDFLKDSYLHDLIWPNFQEMCKQNKTTRIQLLLRLAKEADVRAKVLSPPEPSYLSTQGPMRAASNFSLETLRLLLHAAAEEGEETLRSLLKQKVCIPPHNELLSPFWYFLGKETHLVEILDVLIQFPKLFKELVVLITLAPVLPKLSHTPTSNLLINAIQKVHNSTLTNILNREPLIFLKLAEVANEEEFEWWLNQFDDSSLKQLLLSKSYHGGVLHFANIRTTPLILHHAQRLGVLKELLEIKNDKHQTNAWKSSVCFSQHNEKLQLLTSASLWLNNQSTQ